MSVTKEEGRMAFGGQVAGSNAVGVVLLPSLSRPTTGCDVESSERTHLFSPHGDGQVRRGLTLSLSGFRESEVGTWIFCCYRPGWRRRGKNEEE